jgi:DNA-binding transcriptional LysR family regulator
MDRAPEIRELRYFAAVAEERHFGRAAERIGIAQPALSRAIRALETRLGVTLLERTTRRVELTAAGAALAEEAHAVVGAAEAAARRARRAAEARQRIVVAAKADGDAGLLGPILTAYAREPEAVEADVLLGGWGEQAEQVRDGRADVGVLHLPFDARGLDHEVLVEEPRLVALPAGHPLASRRRPLTLAELAGEPLPRWTGAPDDEVAALWCARDPEAGRGPRPDVPEPAPVDRPPAADVGQVLALVELRRAVAFVPASVAERHRRAGLAFRPVDGLTPIRLAVAWRETARSPAVAALVRAATSVGAQRQALRVA